MLLEYTFRKCTNVCAYQKSKIIFNEVYIIYWTFLAHLTQRVMWAIVTTERPSSVRPLTFHILINSSEATGPIWTKFWWNGPWMAPFQNCVRWSRLTTKMVAKLKIEKRGDEILIVHCCFSINLLLWNRWTKLSQAWQGWSLGGSLSILCPTALPSIQDGCCY